MDWDVLLFLNTTQIKAVDGLCEAKFTIKLYISIEVKCG